jgi:DNA excision repair protein ERCC-3
MPPENPIIVQSDRSILAEVASPRYEEARDWLARIAEMEKSPEHIHSYRITPISLWNAASTGLTADAVAAALVEYSKYPVPPAVLSEVRSTMARWGRLKLRTARSGDGASFVLEADDPDLADEISRRREVAPLLSARDGLSFSVEPAVRGPLKQALLKAGWPVLDLAGYTPGEPFAISLRGETSAGNPFALRDYQAAAAGVFLAGGGVMGGHGVVALPCGAGKTIVAMAVMAELQTHTLILCSGSAAVHQWRRELLDKTHISSQDIGEYTGRSKQVRPITLATYQILTHRRAGAFSHLDLFQARPWGLIVYDEVHLLPAPVFRMTAELQSRRRLGLTATLIREDRREGDVFSLIGPKRYDVPWREMERAGFIAAARCVEVRLSLPPALRARYAVAEDRERHRLAAENPAKAEVVRELLEGHPGEPALVIGQYLGHLHELAQSLGAPIITGETPDGARERLYESFRAGEVPLLVVSRVANFSIDLPDASVCIQVSGTFGSRQEEAQRLGRILRPKARTACFYSVVSRDTVEADLAMNRQRFLTEQGYRYEIDEWDEGRTAEGAADA